MQALGSRPAARGFLQIGCFLNVASAQTATFAVIESSDNSSHNHSALGDRIPAQCETASFSLNSPKMAQKSMASCRRPCAPPGIRARHCLRVGFGLAEAHHLVAQLELAALLEDLYAFEALQDVALGGDGALAFEATMLRHKLGFVLVEKGAHYTG